VKISASNWQRLGSVAAAYVTHRGCAAYPISAPAARITLPLKFPKAAGLMAGIGCHVMALYVPARRTATITQMGGEGANWIGEAPFSSAQACVPESG